MCVQSRGSQLNRFGIGGQNKTHCDAYQGLTAEGQEVAISRLKGWKILARQGTPADERRVSGALT